jgi:hypothetical protein
MAEASCGAIMTGLTSDGGSRPAREARRRGGYASDLRHASCSLLIGEGMPVVEVARQARYAPTMRFDTYAHVMADLDGADRVSAEVTIRAARDAEVSRDCPAPPATPSSGATRAFVAQTFVQRARLRTRTENLFITSEVLYRLS